MAFIVLQSWQFILLYVETHQVKYSYLNFGVGILHLHMGPGGLMAIGLVFLCQILRMVRSWLW